MHSKNEFPAWLGNQLKRKNWRPSGLAKAADVAKSTVTSWLKGDRRPFPDNCHRIASALGFEPATVLEKAGRIHCYQALNDGESLLLGIYRKLSLDRKRAMLEMAEGLHSFHNFDEVDGITLGALVGDEK